MWRKGQIGESLYDVYQLDDELVFKEENPIM